MVNKSTRYFSNKQEKQVAKILNGKQTINSGAAPFTAGDISTEHFLIECKTVTKPCKSFSIKQEMLTKSKKEAFEIGKDNSILIFNFEPNGQNYAVMDINLCKYLIELYNKEQ